LTLPDEQADANTRNLILEKIILEWRGRKYLEGEGVLHHATKSNYGTAPLKFLLNHNCDFNHKDHHGLTPLLYAAKYNQASSVKALIEAIKIGWQDQVDQEGRNVIYYAMSNLGMRLDLHEIEDDEPGSVDFDRADNDEETPLLIAAKEGNVGAVEYLLSLSKNKMGREKQDKMGRGAAYKAVVSGSVEMIQLASREKFDFNSKCNSGSSALEALALLILHENEGKKKEDLTVVFKELAFSNPSKVVDKDIQELLHLYLAKSIITLNYSDKKYTISTQLSLAKLELLMLNYSGSIIDEDLKYILEKTSHLSEGQHLIDMEYPATNDVNKVEVMQSAFEGHRSYYIIFSNNEGVPTSVSYVDGNQMRGPEAQGTSVVTTFAINNKFQNSQSLCQALAVVTEYKSSQAVAQSIVDVTGDYHPTTKNGVIKYQSRGNCVSKSLNILKRELLEIKIDLTTGSKDPESASKIYKQGKRELIGKSIKMARELSDSLLNNPRALEAKQDLLEMAQSHARNKIKDIGTTDANNLSQSFAKKLLTTPLIPSISP
jgi:ankyrin repeat protein